MKKYLFVIFYILSIVFFVSQYTYSQEIITVEVSLTDLNISESIKLTSLQLPEYNEKTNYNVLYKNDIAVLTVYGEKESENSLYLVNLENGEVINSFRYVFQVEEINNSDCLLVTMLLNVQNQDSEKDFTAPSDANQQPTGYEIIIVKLNIDSGEYEILVRNCKTLYKKPAITNSTNNNESYISYYTDYIPEKDTFVYNTGEDLVLYGLETDTIKSINLTLFDYTYLGNLDNLGTLVILNKNQDMELFVYKISYEKLYLIGSKVVYFDIVDDYKEEYYYTIPDFKSFMFLSRPDDTNNDGEINKYDDTKLYILYVEDQKRHLILGGAIDRLHIYNNSSYCHISVRGDSNEDNVIDKEDDKFKLYLYNLRYKQRVLISENGEIIDFIENLDVFLFYSYDKDSNRDKKIDRNDEPSSLSYSIISNRIKSISSYKILKYLILNYYSLVYFIKDNSSYLVYIYDINSGVNKLLAKGMTVELAMPEIGKILLRKSTKYEEELNSELILYDVETSSLTSLGKEFQNLRKFEYYEIENRDHLYAQYNKEKNYLIMIQQAVILNSRGEQELSKEYNLIIYDIKNKIKTIALQGEIFDFSYLEVSEQIVTTIKVKDKKDFETYIIDLSNLKTVLIRTGFQLVDVTGFNNEYIILCSTDLEKALYVYDSYNLIITKISENLIPLSYTTENLVYGTNNRILFLAQDRTGNKKVSIFSPMNDILIVGNYNYDFLYRDDLKYFILVNFNADTGFEFIFIKTNS